MTPIIPLIRDLIQPLQRELPGHETTPAFERESSDDAQPLVTPLQRSGLASPQAFPDYDDA